MKQAIVEFVPTTATKGSPKSILPIERIATFDEDGTPWVEHPMYWQVMYGEAKAQGWSVISMKNDWNVILPIEGK